jgi:hypothetical protein
MIRGHWTHGDNLSRVFSERWGRWWNELDPPEQIWTCVRDETSERSGRRLSQLETSKWQDHPHAIAKAPFFIHGAFRDSRHIQTMRKDSRGSLPFSVSKPRTRRIAQLSREISCEEKNLQLLSEDLERGFCRIAWK